MDASIVNALRRIGQIDCTVHRVTAIVMCLVGGIIFMYSYRRIQSNKKKPMTAEKLVFVASGLCVIFFIVSFLVLSTDWGCAVVAIRNASRLV